MGELDIGRRSFGVSVHVVGNQLGMTLTLRLDTRLYADLASAWTSASVATFDALLRSVVELAVATATALGSEGFVLHGRHESSPAHPVDSASLGEIDAHWLLMGVRGRAPQPFMRLAGGAIGACSDFVLCDRSGFTNDEP